MNKYQKELLNKCGKEVGVTENIPLLDEIYIIPQTKKHESGYKMMYVIGYIRKTEKYYLLDTISDVIDLGEYGNTGDISIDIKHNGIIHLWSRRKKFKSDFRVSSCTFELI